MGEGGTGGVVGGGKGGQPGGNGASEGQRKGTGRARRKRGRRASLGIGARGSLESDGALGAASRGGSPQGVVGEGGRGRGWLEPLSQNGLSQNGYGSFSYPQNFQLDEVYRNRNRSFSDIPSGNLT